MAPAADVDLVVLGAGPAGLGGAYRATGAGRSVVVVERAERVGGAAGSFEVAGVRVDHGSHRLHRSVAPEILEVLCGLLGDDLQTRPRRGRIRLAGRWLPFPLTPLATVRHLPPGFAARAARDAVTGRSRSPRADTFDEVVRAGLGPTMAERFYGPYARKLWGLDPTEISGAQARARIGAASAGALLRRVLAGRDPAARTFLYPRRGFGQLWEALADAAVAQGAQLRLGSAATGVAADEHGVSVTLADGERVRGRHLWSTVPLPLLARLVTPAAPSPVLDAAARLRSRALVLVYLVCAAPRYSAYDAHYLPEAWTPVTRVSEPTNYRDGHPGPHDDGDPEDRTVLCAEIPCQPGDATWRAGDHDLAAVVVRALQQAGLPPPPLQEVAVRRLPSAYPIYDLDFAAALGVVDAWARTLPRITSFGRQGLHVHDNSHHALAMAWAAADALRDDGTRDEAAWRAARERFSTHVVED